MSEMQTVAVCSPSTSDSSTVSRGSRGAKEAITGNIIHYFEVVDDRDKNLKAHCTLVHLVPNHSPVPETRSPILRNT